MLKYSSISIILFLLAFCPAIAQEEVPFIAYDVPSQNLLKFNRFLLNPTFSTVREDKSYINLFHRNQSASFADNPQTYFLSYSGRIGDRSGVGVGLYTQRKGLIDNFGLLANYAYGIKLSDKSNFTFGANFSYYNSGFNRGRANPAADDPLLNSLDDSALITFQPGFNISYGNFDLGLLAENLFDHNLKTREALTSFDEKTFTGHLQYSSPFKNSSGILENGRLMSLARVQDLGGKDVSLGGSLILDLPKLGWLQAGYDDFYGIAAGIGFNLNKRLSLGYTVEKGLSNNFENFGANHEISLAYSFVPNLTEDRVLLEKNNEKDVPVEELSVTEKDHKIAELEEKLAKNNIVIDSLLTRQDSIERTRRSDLERRFNTVMKMVRRETGGKRPDVEERAKEIFLRDQNTDTITGNPKRTPLFNGGPINAISPKPNLGAKDRNQAPESQADRIALVNTKRDKTRAPRKPRDKTPFKNLKNTNVGPGHYLIANVYKNKRYMNAFLDSLMEKGIEAGYFTHTRNGLSYVYLKNYGTLSEAIAAHKSHFNGRYSGDTWVMRVRDYVVSTESVKNNERYENNILQKNVINKSGENQQRISQKTINTNGIRPGFYIIANVFANPNNAKRFVKELNAKGLNASYFINPKNDYRYVYLKKHQEWTTALTAYYSKLDNHYVDPIWIMRVKPNPTS